MAFGVFGGVQPDNFPVFVSWSPKLFASLSQGACGFPGGSASDHCADSQALYHLNLSRGDWMQAPYRFLGSRRVC